MTVDAQGSIGTEIVYLSRTIAVSFRIARDPGVSAIRGLWPMLSLALLMVRLVVLFQKVQAEIPVNIAPNGVNMVRVVLCVIELYDE